MKDVMVESHWQFIALSLPVTLQSPELPEAT